MTTRRTDKTSAPPPRDGDGSAEGDLYTSEDLFGELVDEPPPARAPEAGPAPARKGPIKVQVSEPGAPRKQSPLASPATPGEKLPDDVAALLDAFSEPAEAAARQEFAAGPAPVDELVDEPDRDSGAEEAEGARDEPPTPAVPTPLDEDEDLLLEVLEPAAEAAGPPSPSAGRPATPPAARDDEGQGRRDLGKLGPRPAPTGAEDDLEAIKPTSRTATKFTAASAPRKEAPGPALDLAALAEDAFLAVDAPTPAAPEEAEPPEVVLSPGPSGPSAGEAAPPAAPAATGPTPATHDYGPYRLLERVAVGGMAEVFRAKRTGVEGFEKVVAVKRILSHLSDNKEFVDMFIDEAKMVAGLSHPNIVQIFDLGKLEKNYFIAMEYVHGRDLRTILRRARERGLRVPLDISTYVVSKVCAALEYAHRKKDERGQPVMLVHRDISPQNILISFEGDVKLTDFGIAKAATKASSTDKGALRGKLLYMSPEQAWGKPMDKRSDVFSLGIVFYEMLTEQKPFLGTSEMSILETVRECRVPPPTTVNDRIPEKLERVVMKALERDPEVRYQDAGDMLRDLERVLHEWQPASANGLVRFLEILFDERERDVVGEHGTEHHTGSGARLEMDVPESTTGPTAPGDPAATPVKDPMSIQKLLKRFGIK
ncbi:MAG TPA: protein kinase [Vicinamibacteria bacterium]|nr:protein kinase [Vicinamibacteria bacterium]